ncbi:MAG TPA: TIGR01458 family HAD-type hydrolase [Chromatiales bacterium]|nr:TIGR01458 family HAD-type hydrolase [Chromatiales bacterium]
MKGVEAVLLDLSGVLYVGDAPLAGAREALGRLRAAGVPVRYVTNTSRSTRADVAARLARMGFAVDEAEIFTAPRAALARIRARGLRPFLLIHPGLRPEFAGVPTEPPDAVFVGDAGEAFTYAALNRAFRLLMDGAPLLAVGRNRYFREPDGLSLDAGPFVAALEHAAGVEAEIVGKPAPAFFHAACADLGVAPARCLMIGDDVEADVLGALGAGLQALLVRTGKCRPGDEARLPPGTPVADDLAAAVALVLGAGGGP